MSMDITGMSMNVIRVSMNKLSSGRPILWLRVEGNCWWTSESGKSEMMKVVPKPATKPL